MLCVEFEDRMTDYLEGTLSAEAHRLCAEHVLRCPLCHDLLGEVRQAVAACRASDAPVAPPVGLEARVLAATAPETLMACAEFEARLTDYLDGFLPASLYHRWERHAALCNKCTELPGAVVRSIGACYTAKSEELPIPAHLHASILEATLGTTNSRDVRAPLTQRILANVRAWLDRAVTPQFATVATMLLVAVLVGTTTMSDDGTIGGMYRAGFRLAAQTYLRGANSAAQTSRLPSELRRAAGDWALFITDTPEPRQIKTTNETMNAEAPDASSGSQSGRQTAGALHQQRQEASSGSDTTIDEQKSSEEQGLR